MLIIGRVILLAESTACKTSIFSSSFFQWSMLSLSWLCAAYESENLLSKLLYENQLLSKINLMFQLNTERNSFELYVNYYVVEKPYSITQWGQKFPVKSSEHSTWVALVIFRSNKSEQKPNQTKQNKSTQTKTAVTLRIWERYWM